MSSAKRSSQRGSQTPGLMKARKDMSKSSKPPASRPTPQQVKTKPAASRDKKKRNSQNARVYTDKELDLPTLNMITPAGVQKPRGKKKGKVFVDDQESMKTILAIVHAEKEGQIESKMVKARQLEEIRQAREKESEARQSERRSKVEETKRSIHQNRARKVRSHTSGSSKPSQPSVPKPQKRVSFE